MGTHHITINMMPLCRAKKTFNKPVLKMAEKTMAGMGKKLTCHLSDLLLHEAVEIEKKLGEVFKAKVQVVEGYHSGLLISTHSRRETK